MGPARVFKVIPDVEHVEDGEGEHDGGEGEHGDRDPAVVGVAKGGERGVGGNEKDGHGRQEEKNEAREHKGDYGSSPEQAAEGLLEVGRCMGAGGEVAEGFEGRGRDGEGFILGRRRVVGWGR